VSGRRLLRRVAAVAGTAALGNLLRTVRFVVEGERTYLPFHEQGRPVVFVLWHGRLLPLAWLHRGQGVVGLVSRSEDGELITRILRRWGFGAVRGSSSRGGSAALRQLVGHLEAGRSLALTPDGPRGPRQQMKPGALLAACAAGAPLIPVAAGCDRAWWFGTWDRFLVPKPFARIRVRYGPALHVPAGLHGSSLAEHSARLQDALNGLTAAVDAGSVAQPRTARASAPGRE
jgi:lysophospholipid acyltransferase (LPLAT)-like uncharacterized protein